MENTKSSAVRPVIESAYPKVVWTYTDFFGYLAQKRGSPNPTTNFDANNNIVDESKWRDFSIHVSPQKRFEAAFQKGFLGIKPNTIVSATRAHSSSSVYVTIDTRVVYRIKELVYPGNEAIEVQGKWIYAFHLKSLTTLAEIFTASPNKWLFRYNPTFSPNDSIPPPDKICDGKLELPMIKADESPTSVGFFISPFRLTSDAIKFLLEDAERLKAACVRPVRESAQSLFAAVPDPYQWAADAHEKYYIPLLNEWQNYIFNPERQARLFIASTLKAWINADDKGIIHDSKDPLDIEDELKSGEPDCFINQYKSEEVQLSIKAEKAAAYVYHCVYAPEHRAAENAALESCDASLTLTFQNWAIVCERATETAQGRMFAVNAFNDATRLPNKYLFSEDAPESLFEKLKSYFPNTRYAWLAAIAIASDLLPVVIKHITEKNVRSQIYKKMIDYLERLGIEKGQMIVPKGMPKYLNKEAGKIFYQQLKQNKEITEGLKGQGIIERVEKLYKTVLKESDAEIIQKIGDDSVNAFSKRFNESIIGRNRFKIAYVFETLNVIAAIADFLDSNQKNEWNNDKFVSLLGAEADFSATLGAHLYRTLDLKRTSDLAQAGLTEAEIAAMPKGKAMASVGALTGIAGIIGGICQMSDEERQMVEGYGQYDYGVVAGHGIAAAGAAMTAVGGGFVLAEAIGAGSAIGGPFGAILGAVGAGLIIGGNLLAVWLKDRPHEQFARFCSFGKQYDTVSNKIGEFAEQVIDTQPIFSLLGKQPFKRTPIYPDWSSEGGLPTGDILKEARLLVWLLSSFQIELEQKNVSNPTTGNKHLLDSLVKITPGYLMPTAKVEIKIEQTYTAWHSATPSPNMPEEKFETTLLVDQMTNEVSYLHGDIIPSKNPEPIKLDKFQNIEHIRFSIRPERIKFDNKMMSFDEFLHYGGAVGYINSPQRYLKSSVVKVQISMDKIWQPSASQFLQYEIPYGGEKVVSTDNSKWSD